MNLSVLLMVSVCSSASLNNSVIYKTDDFKKIILPGTVLEKVAGNFNFTEGPVWSSDNELFFSDIPASIIRKWSAEKGISVVNNRSGNSNGLTIDMAGRLIACEHGNRRVTATDADGNVEVIADNYKGKKLNSPNDVVVKSNGTIYFTDPPYGVRAEERELNFQGTYSVSPSGKIKLLNKEMKCPNGLAFSPDEKLLYVADSSERMHIKVFDVTSDGSLKNGRILIEFEKDGVGPPDGLKVDSTGNIWTTGPNGIWIFDKNGNNLGNITVPQVAANCAWGDEDGNTLYITATTAIYRIKTEAVGVRNWIKKKTDQTGDRSNDDKKL